MFELMAFLAFHGEWCLQCLCQRTGIGTKVRDGCEPPGKCWELNLGALEEPGASFHVQKVFIINLS